ncbi:serine protease [Bacillus subtilis]|uniref:trypsin-like serine peptidase n=1 Tax=Bacillus subtilis TaxID=1423 RepID=UPI000F0812F5|nr:serine protease [Bacillus subtilis]MBO3636667.1 serine protease [Bacillus subtilis]MCV2517553.1 serine protease [Bacillus subtilis]QHJ99971.1 Glutamyl endopeptidase [Bacillus subtilis]RNA66537.1 serine protease [Bacillus subtilis]WIY65842.1 serine protease [Bacillus subtilis]
MAEDVLSTMINNKGDKVLISDIGSSPQHEDCFESEHVPEITFERIESKDVSLPHIISFQEDTCGADERSKVTDTVEFPYRAVCELIITTADGRKGTGTGWLVGPRTVITAGHCVFDNDTEQWHKSIEVIPARDHTKEPFGRFESQTFWSVEGWVKHGDQKYDYGAIILDTDIGNKTGYWGFRSDLDSQINKKYCTNIGYPGDKKDENSSTQWTMSGEIEVLSDKKIRYMIDTFGGHSGGPVWLNSSEFQVVGIHAYGGCPNSATRINENVFANIKHWKELGINQ